MRIARRLVVSSCSLLPLLALAAGCQPPPDLISPMEKEKMGVETAKCDAALYPCGPFGYYQDTVVANLAVPGRRDSNKDGVTNSSDQLVTLRLSDYFQNKKVKALLVDVSAEWCVPCKNAQPGLAKLYNDHKAKGDLAILEALIENTSRRPADLAVSDRWATTYKLPFDMSVDPANIIGPYYAAPAFPMQMIIRTKDMTIVYQKNGAPETELRAQIDSIIAE